MKDQSHKDEMSAAIRGDFERLRERGVAATLAPRDEDAPAPAATVERLAATVERLAALPEPDLEAAEPPVAAAAGAEATPEPAPEPSVQPVEAPPDAERTGFFARLLGRA